MGGPVPLPDLYQKIRLTRGPVVSVSMLQGNRAVFPDIMLTSGYDRIPDPLRNGEEVDVDPDETIMVSVKAPGSAGTEDTNIKKSMEAPDKKTLVSLPCNRLGI